jgi:TusA-related sulfurtransferase
LRGEICPFCIYEILQAVGDLPAGRPITVLVDDPLATRSIPEELQDLSGIRWHIERIGDYWQVRIWRE